jgi:hypothetical protein
MSDNQRERPLLEYLADDETDDHDRHVSGRGPRTRAVRTAPPRGRARKSPWSCQVRTERAGAAAIASHTGSPGGVGCRVRCGLRKAGWCV